MIHNYPLLSQSKSVEEAAVDSYCQDSARVHPCSLGRGIHAAHGPGINYPPRL